MKKRVVVLKSRASFRGGLEKYTHYLVRAFADKGCTVTLLTTGKPPLIDGVTTLSVAPDSKCSLYQLTHFDSLCQKWLKENRHEIIFGMERTTVQTHYRAGSGVHAVFLKRRALIDPFWKQLTFPINPLHRKLLAIEKKVFENPNLKIFTNSHMVRKEILQTYTANPESLEVVHNGVEWKKWSENFELSLDNIQNNYFHFLFVGNGYKRKGLLFLLQGLALLRKEDFRLTVIGKDKDPSFFVRWAAKNGLKHRVTFLGPQNDISPFYKEADALVIPSIYDPFANVTVEALAMGLFVVSSCYNGGHEVLQKCIGTVIEDLTSPESVAASLQIALNHPKTQERARLIRHSIKELDFSKQLDKIVSKTI